MNKRFIKKCTKAIQESLPKNLGSDRILYILALFFFMFAVVILLWFGYRYKHSLEYKQAIVNVDPLTQTDTPLCSQRSNISGRCLAAGEKNTPQVVAVMIENHFEARPLSGLGQAHVVYEMPVEGNITRFMALYPHDAQVEEVGPVRSSRGYFLDILSEYGNAMYMHVGGSPEALELIKRYQIYDMDEFYRGVYFWRSKDRYAPHNTYTSSELWNNALIRYPVSALEYESPKWNTETQSCDDSCISTIDIKYPSSTYSSEWRYNKEKNLYERYESGVLHRDRQNQQIEASSIIVQYIETSVVDEVGRLAIDMIGTGKAIIFQNGIMIEGQWRKETRNSRTRFYNLQNEEIALEGGKLWIVGLGQNTELVWE